MNSVTRAIPRRWNNAGTEIVSFLRSPRRLQVGSIESFKVDLTPPLDEGQIWALESSLNASQAIFCDAAIAALNTALNAKTADGWHTTKKVTEQAQRDIDEIELIRARCAER